MIERVKVDHTFPTQVDVWNTLTKKDNWHLTVLLTEDRKQCVAFGCKPAPHQRSGGRR